MTTELLDAPSEPTDTAAERHRRPWWQVVCLTGVDYFSTLGYQPGIAALAAGLLSPLATLVLVGLTLLGALPVYRRVAAESPHGEGSIAMLEHLLGFWKGKLFVLVLLGFAVTDFVITMTLSAADGAVHLVQNPLVPAGWADHQFVVTLVLLAALGAIFLRGFREAIGIAVVLVVGYLGLNAVVLAVGTAKVLQHPVVVTDWKDALVTEHGSIVAMIGVSLLIFPKLALGMSGFETGVAVMPQVRGAAGDTEDRPLGRIRGARRLLTTAAVTMSVFLVVSSLVTTLLIPAGAFETGGEANGRALAYLAHRDLGSAFGTVYDVSTILILWFAGASAMAGLLNLVPRYLPRYGMSPRWAGAIRPLVLIITLTCFGITWYFDADVDAQSGAYATGVLVLMTSAAIAVALAARRKRQHWLTAAFALVSVVFLYTTASNMVERPDGVRIGAAFIAVIVAVSAISRAFRAFELRVRGIELDPAAALFVRDNARRKIRLIAHEPDALDEEEYVEKMHQSVRNHLLPNEDVIFVEVTVTDPSDFEGTIRVRGEVLFDHYRVMRLEAPSVPNALAALLLHIRDLTGVVPHVYFGWTEGNPVGNLAKFLAFGVGEVAPITREVLRRAEPDRTHRPHVHVG